MLINKAITFLKSVFLSFNTVQMNRTCQMHFQFNEDSGFDRYRKYGNKLLKTNKTNQRI